MKKLISMAVLSLGLVATTSVLAQSPCSVSYEVTERWGNNTKQRVIVTNLGAPVTSWQVSWTFKGAEQIESMWDASYAQTGTSITASNLSYNGSVDTGGTRQFGFILRNPNESLPTDFALNGRLCNGQTKGALWLLDAPASNLSFVTIKKNDTPEAHTFTEMDGTLDADGKATLVIPLTSVATNISLRDQRMRDLLFEAQWLPNLYFNTTVNLAAIDAIPVGDSAILPLTGNLTLHGIVKLISFDALFVKTSARTLTVSPRQPLIINSADFDLDAGVELLRNIMLLTSITNKVPVYFTLALTKENPTGKPGLTLSQVPAAASNLTGVLSQNNGDANLNWVDNAANETGFLVRRKDASERWVTVNNLPANSVSFTDNLSVGGIYGFKVIAYKDGVPAPASNLLTLTRTAPGSSSATTTSSSSASSIGNLNGEALFAAQCVSCHALTPTFPAQRNATTLSAYIRTNMPPSNPALCGAECSDAITQFLLSRTFPSSNAAVSSSARSSNSAQSSSTGSVGSTTEAEVEPQLSIRRSAAQTAYSGNNCVICHGENGQGTTLAPSLVNCANCSSWTVLRDYIAANMPQPGACTGTCANGSADFIWDKVNKWTLTKDGTGMRNATSTLKLGDETLRIKSYGAIVADYKRLFGTVPASLTASASTFTTVPSYWYKNPEMGAVALNVMMNVAVEACSTQPMPAPLNATTMATYCTDWANRFWSRAPTDTERASCVAVALESPASLPAAQRPIFACASMLISLPALTY